MKKILVTVALAVVVSGYALRNTTTKGSLKAGSTAAIPSTAGQNTNTDTGGTVPTTAALKDGTYTGPSTFSFYGNVQVQAIVSGGKLTDVKVLQYPNDRANSIQISNRSIPILTSEAIQAQSGSVNVVSGATQTSEAFTTSLNSALTQAQS